MQHMEKAKLYNVDGNRVATAKQIYAVSRHFAALQSKTAGEAYKLTKVFGAIMMKFNAEHSATPITHGDIAKFFELEKVPAKFVEQITRKAPKASPKPKASVKTSTKSEAPKATKASTKPKETPKPKASEQSVDDFKARLESLGSRVTKVEKLSEANKLKVAMLRSDWDIHAKKISTMEAKLDILMAWLETNPEL